MNTYTVILEYVTGRELYFAVVEDESQEAAWRTAMFQCMEANGVEEIYDTVDEAREEFAEPVALFEGDVIPLLLLRDGEFS